MTIYVIAAGAICACVSITFIIVVIVNKTTHVRRGISDVQNIVVRYEYVVNVDL